MFWFAFFQVCQRLLRHELDVGKLVPRVWWQRLTKVCQLLPGGVVELPGQAGAGLDVRSQLLWNKIVQNRFRKSYRWVDDVKFNTSFLLSTITLFIITYACIIHIHNSQIHIHFNTTAQFVTNLFSRKDHSNNMPLGNINSTNWKTELRVEIYPNMKVKFWGWNCFESQVNYWGNFIKTF